MGTEQGADQREERRPEAASEATPETEPRSPRWSRLEIVVIVLLTVAAAALRMMDLGIPDKLSFDETYYAKDACWYAFSSEDLCTISDEQTKVHPPLGKWLISAGVKAFGYDSFGWRFVPALAGIAMVPLLFALARRLFRPLGGPGAALVGATLAAGLLAIDFLHLVQSRISMLDIFAALFALAAVLCLVIDRDRILTSPPARRMMLARPWRAAAGALGAAAAASKWSGALVFAVLVLCSVTWEVSARRSHSGMGRAIGRALVEEGPSIFLYLVVLPAVLYMLTFLGRLDGEPFFSLPWTEGSWFRALLARHSYMYDFHSELPANHPYQSPAWSWILLRRAVSYEFSSEGGVYREVFAAGSPLVWWSSLVALLWVAVAWIRRRDLRRPEGLILAGFVFTYGPWLLPQLSRPAVFLFYLLPTIPFMCLALGYVAARLGGSWEARSAIALFVAGAVGLFVFYLPLLTFRPIPQEEWRQRIWRFDNCDKPPAETTTTTITTSDDEGNPVVTTSETSESDSLPPEGWCWI